MVTLAEVKTQLGITGSSDDVVLTQMIAQAIAHAEREARRPFVQSSRVEFYSGQNTSQLVLRHRPVASVTEVRVDELGAFGQYDDGFAADTLLVEGIDYAVSGHVLHRIGAWWPAMRSSPAGVVGQCLEDGVGNIRVTYVAGLNGMPADVKDAVIQLVARRFANPDGRTVTNESLDYYSVSFANNDASSKEVTSPESVFRSYRKPLF